MVGHKLKYPKSYKALEYGVCLDNPHNKPVIPPVNFMLARAFLSSMAENLDNIGAAYNNLAEFGQEHDYGFIPQEYSLDELVDALKAGVRRKHRSGTMKPLTSGGKEVVKDTHLTSLTVSGKIRSIDSRTLHDVSVRDYLDFGLQRLHFTHLQSTSTSNYFSSMKPSHDGDTKSQRPYHVMDVPLSTLIYAVAVNPDMFNYSARDSLGKVFLPFNPLVNQNQTENLSINNATQVFVESLFDYYVRGQGRKEMDAGRKQMNKADISKRLCEKDFLYSQTLKDFIKGEMAFFNVVPRKMVMTSDADVDKAVKDWYWNGMKKEFLDRYFEQEGLVYIKKNGEHEAVVENYSSKGHQNNLRMIFGDFPPLVMRMWPAEPSDNPKTPKIWITRNAENDGKEHTGDIHPYDELYQIKKVYDDHTRQMMWSVVQIPHHFDLPQGMEGDILSYVHSRGISLANLRRRVIQHDRILKKSNTQERFFGDYRNDSIRTYQRINKMLGMGKK